MATCGFDSFSLRVQLPCVFSLKFFIYAYTPSERNHQRGQRVIQRFSEMPLVMKSFLRTESYNSSHNDQEKPRRERNIKTLSERRILAMVLWHFSYYRSKNGVSGDTLRVLLRRRRKIRNTAVGGVQEILTRRSRSYSGVAQQQRFSTTYFGSRRNLRTNDTSCTDNERLPSKLDIFPRTKKNKTDTP